MKMRTQLCLAAAIVFASAAYAGPSCPIHQYSTAFNTGRVEYINGRSWQVYHCSGDNGHDFLFRLDEQQPPPGATRSPTGGFVLTTLPTAPGVDASDFQGAPQAFQSGFEAARNNARALAELRAREQAIQADAARKAREAAARQQKVASKDPHLALNKKADTDGSETAQSVPEWDRVEESAAEKGSPATQNPFLASRDAATAKPAANGETAPKDPYLALNKKADTDGSETAQSLPEWARDEEPAAEKGSPATQNPFLASRETAAEKQSQEEDPFSDLDKALYPDEQYKMGVAILTQDDHNPDNRAAAFRWFRMAGDRGHGDAQWNLGQMYAGGIGVAEDDAEAVRWFRKSAEQGSPERQTEFGQMLLTGDGIKKDSGEASNWFLKAAGSGYADAQVMLGHRFLTGDGAPKDEVQAVRWYRLAAEQGYAEGQRSLGSAFKYGWGVQANQDEAVRWYEKAAAQGSDWAQWSLGMAYKTGSGVAQDFSKAVEWFTAAADGNLDANYELGLAFISGSGVAKDAETGIRWLSTGAGEGHLLSQNTLGWKYSWGEDVQRDDVEAAKWYRMAAEQGDANAQNSLGLLLLNQYGKLWFPDEGIKWLRKAAEQDNEMGSVAQANLAGIFLSGRGSIEPNPAEAAKWARKAADHGDARWQFELGKMHSRGAGVPQDESLAVSWYERAAKQGFSMAQMMLAMSYSRGTGVLHDQAEAVNWYRKAADEWDPVSREYMDGRGQGMAQSSLGFCYLNGEGVPKNDAEAVKWFALAAKQGYALAQNRLGLLYSLGVGVPQDEVEGWAWINIAAANDESYREARDELGKRLGRQGTILAQQRSREILASLSTEGEASAESTSEKVEKPRATGSGVFVSSVGHCVTAAHIVKGASRIEVVAASGKASATVVQIDEANDLALLKVDGLVVRPRPIAASRKVRLGQSVATIGFPQVQIQGFSPKVTRGDISSIQGAGDDPRLWQVSVPVQAGNSGGPLLDDYGNLVGIVVSKLGLKAASVTGDLPQNVNYAVKSAYIMPLLEQVDDGSIPEALARAEAPAFEDMVAEAKQSVVLILVY